MDVCQRFYLQTNEKFKVKSYPSMVKDLIASSGLGKCAVLHQRFGDGCGYDVNLSLSSFRSLERCPSAFTCDSFTDELAQVYEVVYDSMAGMSLYLSVLFNKPVELLVNKYHLSLEKDLRERVINLPVRLGSLGFASTHDGLGNDDGIKIVNNHLMLWLDDFIEFEDIIPRKA